MCRSGGDAPACPSQCVAMGVVVVAADAGGRGVPRVCDRMARHAEGFRGLCVAVVGTRPRVRACVSQRVLWWVPLTLGAWATALL